MDREHRESEERAWVERVRPMVEMAAQNFLETGEWPEIQSVQRRMDARHYGIEVQAALREIPRLPGEQNPYVWSTVVIPIRIFKHIPQGAHLLPVCLSIVQLAVRVWLSEVEPASIRNDNPELRRIMPGRSTDIWLRAGHLLQSSLPTVLSGGGWGPDHWELLVNGPVARQLENVSTIEDYFDAQASIMEAALALRDPPSTASKPSRPQMTMFVMMPFRESWSAEAMELFCLAADRIDVIPKIHVYRADQIEAFGRITDQITDAIRGSDVILADTTDVNPNVMWELGYAQALERKIVIVNQDITGSPFDIREWRQIEYSLPANEEHVRSIAAFIQGSLGLT
jgi:hypothetical protein